MNLNAVIEHLRAHVPAFDQRVAGAAQFQAITESTNVMVPYAFVVPLDENADPNQSSNGYRQTVEDSFAVIVALDNRGDERGQASSVNVHATRVALIQKLVGWKPAEDYDEIEYEGGSFLRMDRARLWYQFEFKALYYLDHTDTWIDERNKALPKFEGVTIKLDAIDPADPNHPKQDYPDDPNAYPGGSPGPDGRSEGGAVIDLPTT